MSHMHMMIAAAVFAWVSGYAMGASTGKKLQRHTPRPSGHKAAKAHGAAVPEHEGHEQ